MWIDDQQRAHALRVAIFVRSTGMPPSPLTVRAAAAVQAAEAAVVCVASVLSAVDAAAGRSYQTGSGIALTLIGFGTAAALGWVAVGLARARQWSRTPSLLTQLFTGIVGTPQS
jgi:hypothetical protein